MEDYQPFWVVDRTIFYSVISYLFYFRYSYKRRIFQKRSMTENINLLTLQNRLQRTEGGSYQENWSFFCVQ